MRQRLVAYLTFLCALLLPLAAVTWGRSYVYNDTVYGVANGYALVIDTIGGELSVWFGPVDPRAGERRGRDSFPADEGITAQDLLRREPGIFQLWLVGFGYAETPALPSGLGAARRGAVVRAVVVPWWFVAVLVALLPGRVLVRYLHAQDVRRRESAGTCRGCGYDLRDGDVRCPECGEPATSAAPESSAAA